MDDIQESIPHGSSEREGERGVINPKPFPIEFLQEALVFIPCDVFSNPSRYDPGLS
jgi:hypothetical protein